LIILDSSLSRSDPDRLYSLGGLSRAQASPDLHASPKFGQCGPRESPPETPAIPNARSASAAVKPQERPCDTEYFDEKEEAQHDVLNLFLFVEATRFENSANFKNSVKWRLQASHRLFCSNFVAKNALKQ